MFRGFSIHLSLDEYLLSFLFIAAVKSVAVKMDMQVAL